MSTGLLLVAAVVCFAFGAVSSAALILWTQAHPTAVDVDVEPVDLKLDESRRTLELVLDELEEVRRVANTR